MVFDDRGAFGRRILGPSSPTGRSCRTDGEHPALQADLNFFAQLSHALVQPSAKPPPAKLVQLARQVSDPDLAPVQRHSDIARLLPTYRAPSDSPEESQGVSRSVPQVWTHGLPVQRFDLVASESYEAW